MISFFYQKKGQLSICEDSLTASTFGLLKYLPTELFWRILKQSLFHKNNFPVQCGELRKFEFWEKMKISRFDFNIHPKFQNEIDDIYNKNFVEPDVFLRFENFDIIIEAKRYDENQQRQGQFLNEINAYYNQYGTENKQLYFIQMGGLNDKKDEEHYLYKDRRIYIFKTDWTHLLEQILVEENNQLNIWTKEILRDLIWSFELHGYLKTTWLESVNKSTYKPINYIKPINLFDYAK